FAEIDDKIATVENELQEINQKINHAGSDYRLLEDLDAQRDEMIKHQDELLERWTYLNELAEAIEEQKKTK
ncbi:MAG TPA: ABC transporter C-terminal domain-containing protein, partial [Syntrophomonas sp.]|nr:ABC transporter C-terminal domain-containing protein [Syntrophomonas sp.]